MRGTFSRVVLSSIVLTAACSSSSTGGTSAKDRSDAAAGRSDASTHGPDAGPSADAGRLAPADPRVHGGITLGGPFLSGDCDPLVPSHCGLPFPSNVYLPIVTDPAKKTGRRVEFGATTLPKNAQGVQAAPDEFRRSDGFSPGDAFLTLLPGATTTGLPSPLTIAKSLTLDSPTILINAQTGALVPHFAELDVGADTDETRAFMIRPAVRLDDATRYIVAIRRVVDASGKAIPPSEAFLALRDGKPSSEASVAARRTLYADIFARLGAAGVKRDDLQIAWDMTTASRENNTEWMLHIRDEGLKLVGPDGPAYTIDKVTPDPSASTKLRIEGHVTVPLYLDKPDTGGKFVFGSDGMPKQNGTADYPFLVLIPVSATKGTPGVPVQNGHGLFGSRDQIEGFADRADTAGWVLVGTDFIGMASDDIPNIAKIITGGDIGAFRSVPDRMSQGYLNMMLVTRMMRGNFAKDPVVQFGGKSAIDTTKSYYFGGSEGGILGATFMALTPDILRGGLEVAGQSYNLLLNRSVDFDPYWAAIKGAYPNPLDVQLLLGLVQMQWDRAEPTGYSRYIVNDPLPGTPSHEVLLQLSIGDHQVSTLGGHIMARAIGVKNLRPVNRTIFGLDEVDGPYKGSALIEYDFGLPPEPITNVPDRDGADPHGAMKGVPAAGDVLLQFLQTGVVNAACNGKCDPG
jgi:hypothetical protein